MIVYLGWGSLIWNSDFLPILSNASWVRSNLKLPLEYSRISDKGKGRLTLVIDNKNGIYNRIWYTKTTTNNVNVAINKLKKREKTVSNNIAYINLKKNKFRINNTPIRLVNNIIKWMKNKNFDTVIWTNLNSNWKKIKKTPYSIERAYKYFINSELDIRIKILEYLYKTNKITKIKTKFSQYFFNKLN